MSDAGNSSTANRIYVTLTGLPLRIDLQWPFHKSGSGADFWVLHGDVTLASTEGLHAPVAVNLSATVREVLPSLEPKDAEAPVINSLRKEVDRRQLEFLRSGKLVPVHFSSRHYDFKRNRWVFGAATEEAMQTLVARKVFWHTRSFGGRVWIGDPTEALYVESTVDQVVRTAAGLAQSGLMTIEGEWASANAALMAQAEKFAADAKAAQLELEKKHAFEDARRAG